MNRNRKEPSTSYCQSQNQGQVNQINQVNIQVTRSRTNQRGWIFGVSRLSIKKRVLIKKTTIDESLFTALEM
jgi:hypothetical protein